MRPSGSFARDQYRFRYCRRLSAAGTSLAVSASLLFSAATALADPVSEGALPDRGEVPLGGSVEAPPTTDAPPSGSGAPSSASADLPRVVRDPLLVPVEFQTGPDPLSVSVSYEGGEPTPRATHGTCTTPCRLWLPPGKYAIDLSDAQGDAKGRRRVDVHAASRVWVYGESTVQRDVGLIVVATSFASIAAGLYALSKTASTSTGALLSLAGLFSMPIGWSLYGFSDASAKVEPMSAASPSASTARHGARLVAPAGLGLRVAF